MSRTLDESAHARTRDRILDAARSLFADEGYHAASMNAVAEACQLTKAGLYHYFPSKQSILGALHQQMVAEAEANIDRFPRFDSLEQALEAAGQKYLEHFRDPRHFQMMQVTFKLGLQDLGKEDPGFAFDHGRMNDKLLSLFLPYLPQGTTPEQAKLFATQFFGSLYFRVFAAGQLCPIEAQAEPDVYLKQLVRTFAADPKAALRGAS